MLGAGVRVLVIGAGIAGSPPLARCAIGEAAVEIVERQLDPPGEGRSTCSATPSVSSTPWASLIRWPNALSASDGSGRPKTAAERCSRSTSTSCGAASDPVRAAPDGPASSAARRRRHQPAPRSRALTWQQTTSPWSAHAQGDIAAEMERARVDFHHLLDHATSAELREIPMAPSGLTNSCCSTCSSGTYWSTTC